MSFKQGKHEKKEF